MCGARQFVTHRCLIPVEFLALITDWSLAHLVRPRTLTGRLQAHPCLSLGELAFAHDTLMRFVGALDAILGLVIAGKLFDYRENSTWYKPTD